MARQADSMGGNRDVPIVVHDDVPCWVQQASSSEVMLYQQRGMSLSYKIFFVSDLGLNEQHEIVVTRYREQAVEFNPGTVLSGPSPDASAGLGLLWRVMTGIQTPEFTS
jgi:hypothetical protein